MLLPRHLAFPKGQIALVKKVSRRAGRMVPGAALRSAAAVLALFALFGFNPQALAETDTWQGSAGSTDLATAGNWTYSGGGAGPVATGDTIVFTSVNNSTSTTLTDSLTSNTQLAITFAAGALAYTLTGNSIQDFAGWSDQSTNVETINNPVNWAASHSVTVATGGDLVFAGIISGADSFETNTASGGVITFMAANSFTTATSILANATIDYENGTAFGTNSVITVSSGGTAQVQGGITGGTKGSLTISGAGAADGTGALENVSGTNNVPSLVVLGASATISSDAGTINLTNTGTMTGSGDTLTLTGTAGNGNITSIIGTGAGGVTMNGGGTWTLNGANTFTGAITINAGTLAIGGAGKLDAGSYAGNISDAGTFSYGSSATQTLSGIISGAGALTEAGAGPLTLTGVNTYTGNTAIGTAATLTISGVGQLNSGAYAGNISNAGTLSYVSSAAQTLSGVISGAGALTENNAAADLTLSGPNTYAGGTTLTTGTLALNNGASGTTTSSAIGTGALTIAGGTTIDSTVSGITLGTNNTQNWNGSFTFNGTNSLNLGTGAVTLGITPTVTVNANTLTVGGAIGGGSFGLTTAGAGTLALTGVNTYTGATTIGAGTLAITGAGQLGSGSYAGGISDGGTLSFSSSANQSLSGIISGVGALTQAGPGNLTLTNANSYGGGTTVSGGKLTVNNSSGSGTGTGGVAVNGGTLVGSGAISGTVTLGGGTIAPGTAGVTLTIGGLVYNSGTLSFTLNGAGDTSSLVAATTAAFDATPTITFTPFNISNGDTFTLLTSTSPITGGSFLSSIATTHIGRITLTTTESGNSLIATASGSPATLIWAGGVAGLGTGTASQGDGSTWNNTQNNGGSNWNNGGHYDYFYDLDAVTFNDAGSPTHTVNLTTVNSPGSVTVNTASSYTFTGSGSIGGAGGLTVSGGTLNLDTANSYSGGTNISAGALLVSGTAGALPGGSTVTVAGTLNLSGDSQTIGALSDGGVTTGVVQSTSAGAPTLTLNNGGSVSGELTLSNLALSVGGGTLSLTGTLAGGSSAATIATNGTGIINETSSGSIINSTASFNQGSSGTSILGGANTYTGATTVSGGTLSLTGTLNGSNVSNGATFTEGSTGVISGAGVTFTNTAGTGTLGGSNPYGGVTNVSGGTLNLTGTLTASNVSNGATFTESSTGVISGAGVTFANTAGTSTLSGVNTYGGATTIGAGTLAISGAGQLGSGSYAGAISDAGTLSYGSSATQTLSGIISGAGVLTEAGPGTLTVSGVNTYTGATTVSGGVLNYSGSLGVAPASAAGAINVGVSGGGNATLNIPSGATITLGNANELVGNGISNTTGQGFVFQSTGSTVSGVNNVRLGAGASGSSYGYYKLSGGSLSTSEMDLGGPNGAAAGVLDMSGGTLNISSNLYLAEGTGGTGILNLTGGTLTISGAGFGTNGTATGNILAINIANASLIAGSASLSLASSTTTASGELNLLPGGLLQILTFNPAANSGVSSINFNGGTLQAAGATTTFVAGANNNTNTINVFSGGGTIDNNGFAISVTKVISAPTTGGLTSAITVTNGGAGYVGAPAVTFSLPPSGNNDTDAAGYAIVSGGVVTSIVITNPGSGYTTAPTITLTGGGYTSLASATAPAPAANTSGGMTFTGAGTTTNTRIDTYTGPTAVTGGILDLTGSLSATASESVSNGGTLELGGANDELPSTAPVTLTAGTLETLASKTQALGALTLGAGSSTLTLGATASIIDFADSGSDTWTGTLAIDDWNGASAGGGSDQVAFAADDLTAGQLADITFVNPTIDGVSYPSTTFDAAQLSDGEIVATTAVPEPGTWATLLGGLGMMIVWQRSRRGRIQA
jgi:fibronectin-binding autotransporter adhesin